MIVAEAEHHIISANTAAPAHSAKIHVNAHAFKMLSSGLYSDKVAAVLREIGCNAADAHIQAGCPNKSIEVKLPNALDNQFYIKDFGLGLSHDDVMNLYQTYFLSTKQKSNDYTGAFGLGSKSPYSYTDSFTIVSCHNGVQRVYTAHLNNVGVPETALMGQKPTTESGITISFPVKREDFADFQAKAADLFRYFTPLPVIKGGKPIIPLAFSKDYGSYAFFKENTNAYNQYGRYGTGNFVQMGNVHYPLSLDSLNFSAADAELKQNTRYMSNILLRFPIGSLQVAGSREQLQYDPASQEMIKKALRATTKDVCLELEAAWNKLNKGGSWAEIVKYKDDARAIIKNLTISEEMLKEAGVADPKEIHTIINTNFFSFIYKEIPDVSVVMLEKNIRKNTFQLRQTKRCTTHCQFADDISIVAGTESSAMNRVRAAFKEDKLDGRVILVSLTKDQSGDVSGQTAELQKVFKGVTLRSLSEFPAPKFAGRLKKGQLPVIDTKFVIMDDVRTTVQAVPPERKLYLPASIKTTYGRTRVHPIINGHGIQTYDWIHIKDSLDTLSSIMKMPKPVLISPADITRMKLDQRPEWKSYEAVLAEKMNSKECLDALRAKVGAIKFRLGLYDSHNSGLLQTLVVARADDATKELYASITPILKEEKIYETVETIYKNSLTPDTNSSIKRLFTTYRDLAATFNIAVKAPEFDAPIMTMDDKYPKSKEITYSTLKEIYSLAPDVVPLLLKSIMRT